jgi:hypothetical protein
MASRKKWSFAGIARQLLFFIIGALLTGFLTVFCARFLAAFVGQHWSVTLGVACGVSLTLWVSQWVRHPPFLLKGTSPLIAGFCAGLGVHISRVWLN